MWCLTLTLTLSSPTALADPLEQTSRVELSLEGFDRWDVIPLGADGLVLVGQEDKGDGFQLRKLDTGFTLQWTSDYHPDGKVRFTDAAVSDEAVWLAFSRPGRESFTLVGFDRASGERVEIPCEASDRLVDLDGLVVDDDGHAWALGIMDARRRGDLVAIDLRAKTATPMHVADALGDRKMYFQQIVTGPGEDDRAVTTLRAEKKRFELQIVPFGPEGLSAPLTLPPPTDQEVNLLSGVRVPVEGDRGMVLGTYASGLKGRMAQGMFVGQYEGQAPTWMKYHSFTSFDHFFDYLPDRKRERILATADRKSEAGKDLDLNYLLLPHAPLILPDRTVLVAEAYYPKYHQYTTTSTSTVNGKTTTTTTVHTVFDGWMFTHAVVAAFSPTGERLWDASAPIGNVLLPQVRPVVTVLPQGDRVTIVYPSKGKIYSVVADAMGVTGERGEQAPETEEEGERVKTSWDSHAAWWYDDVFLLWGFEKVKGDGGRRTVFSFSTLKAPPLP